METGKTVLIVDDEVHIVNVVAMKFKSAGFNVLTARDPQEAFEIAQQARPDLVVTDHQMPGGSGLDLCKSLGSIEQTRSTPAILLTAYDFSIGDESLEDSNVELVLPKPFSPRELLAKAQAILEKKAEAAT
jgi:two-component system phosphate regulon response regulator PhoB